MKKELLYWGIGICICVVLCSGLIIRWIALGTVPLHDWDEAIYAQAARETHGLTPYYNGAPWFEKPPLPLYVLKLATAIGGESILAQRAPALILGMCVLMLTAYIAYRYTHDITLTLLAPTGLVTSTLFIDRSSLVNVDMYLVCGWLIYMAFSLSRWRIIGIILGTWSKSLLGFIPLCVDMCYRLATGKLTKIYIIETTIALCVGLSWHSMMYTQYGWIFIQEHILDHMIARVTTPIELHFGGIWFYPTLLFKDMSLLAIVGLTGCCLYIAQQVIFLHKNHRQLSSIHESTTLYCNMLITGTALIYMLFLTVTKAKLHWYLTPLVPLLSIGIVYIGHVHRIFKYVLWIYIIYLLITRFIPNTYSFNISDYTASTKTRLAFCIQEKLHTLQTPHTRIYMLVSPQERIDAQVMEAAQLTIGSSKRYGGAPALLYILNKIPIYFIYKIENIVQMSIQKDDIVIFHTADFSYMPLGQKLCAVDDWVGMIVK